MTSFRAPGRVNLIGDHTDYNDGFVLPMAIQLECVVDARPSGDGSVRLRSLDFGGTVEIAADGSVDPEAVSGWGNYPAGVVRALAERGRPPVGMEATVTSTVPVGAGLSSSAAHSVSLALALCDAAGFELPPLELARACQHAEQIASGVPCGIMDQLTAVAARRGAALLIDCRSLAVRPVPLPGDLVTIAVHCGLARSLAASAYAERRAACERVARELGVAALRDATPDQVTHDPRARHVVLENARVLDAVHALESRDYARLGALLSESHASLRDDFEVSTPELDALVTALEAAGALGARLTGAGFGGCAVAIVERDRAAGVTEAAVAEYRASTGLQPTVYVCCAADGAARATAPALTRAPRQTAPS